MSHRGEMGGHRRAGNRFAIARGTGVEDAHTVATLRDFDRQAEAGLAADRRHIVAAKVAPSVGPGIGHRPSDGRAERDIFVLHGEASEGITAMGPSEQN